MTSLMSSDDLDALNTPIEGEVVEPRRRERNEGRSAEILPPDVESKVTALRTLGGESQARSVTVMLNHARTGLLTAIAAQDLPGIVEYKQKAHAITEISKQLRLGKELQLDAAEFLRRAERGLGVAIRKGQADGTVETKSEASARGSAMRDGLLDKHTVKPRPKDFAKPSELSGNSTHGDPGIYGMTDGVSDDQFDSALAEAKAEGNLSRANVGRKARAKAEPAISESDPLIDADVASKPAARPTVKDVLSPEQLEELKRPKRTTRGRKTVETIAVTVENLSFAVRDISPTEADPELLRQEITRAFDAIGVIRKFLREVQNQ